MQASQKYGASLHLLNLYQHLIDDEAKLMLVLTNALPDAVLSILAKFKNLTASTECLDFYFSMLAPTVSKIMIKVIMHHARRNPFILSYLTADDIENFITNAIAKIARLFRLSFCFDY